MSAEYRLRFSHDYLVTSVLRYRQQVPWRRPFIGVKWLLALPVAALVVLSIYSELYALGAVFTAVLTSLVLGWPIDKWLLRRRLRKSPFNDRDLVFTLSDAGVHLEGGIVDTRLTWSAYTKARRFTDGLLLFHGPHTFNWLPDAAAIDPGVPAIAQQMARANVPDYRDV
jgi:hypothetical protein